MSFREQIVFDVPRENYTIQQLLLDSKEYWNVTDSSFRLHSSSTGNIWPSSATIGQILKPNTVLHLTSSNVVKSARRINFVGIQQFFLIRSVDAGIFTERLGSASTQST